MDIVALVTIVVIVVGLLFKPVIDAADKFNDLFK